MKPSLVFEALKISVEAKMPTYLWGSMGVGKSDIVRQVVDHFRTRNPEFGIRDVRAILLDPVDLRGLPHVNGGGRAHWAVPEFLPREGAGVLFLDELVSAPTMVQAACYQLILDRKLGEYELPDGWMVIAAGNRQSDRGVYNRMPMALANRFIHVDFEPDYDDWAVWAYRNHIRSEVISYLNFEKKYLHAYDPQSDAKAFPTPRSWAVTSKILDQTPADEVKLELLKGTIGDVAGQFYGYLKICDKLQDPDFVLEHPETAPIPVNDPSVMYATCGSLAYRASIKTIDSIVKYINRFPDKEFAALTIRDCIKKEPLIQKTRPYIEWISKNSNMMR